MKAVVIILLSFLLTTFFTMPIFAAGKSAEQKQITGTVSGINTARKTITVTKKDKEIVLNLEEKTKIVQCIDNNELSDIKIGDRVTIQYQDKEDNNSVKSVTIKNTAP